MAHNVIGNDISVMEFAILDIIFFGWSFDVSEYFLRFHIVFDKLASEVLLYIWQLKWLLKELTPAYYLEV